MVFPLDVVVFFFKISQKAQNPRYIPREDQNERSHNWRLTWWARNFEEIYAIDEINFVYSSVSCNFDIGQDCIVMVNGIPVCK